ncbi:hypothetical protein NC653_010703 [Populus alba x Populus x berolinensis]|uniref:Uncharacterized protein n=1 Tax=Populus alba x Populus x berolinensis TaxID=444605 RepID=A0AAD6W6P4_9ROSI|nr:hypothetical protein NC653_010703 [Populus alba x Populus x berolinensis]
MEAVVAVLHKKEEKNQRYASKSRGSYNLHSLNILDLLFLRHPNMCYNPTVTFMRVRKKSTVDPPLKSIRLISPLTNAFCNSPHRPVFRGPMVVTPCFRQVNSKPPTTMIKTPSIGIIRTYIHVFLEVPLLGDLAPIVGGLTGESNVTQGIERLFFASGLNISRGWMRNNPLRSSQVVGDVQNWRGSLHFAQVILLSAKGIRFVSQAQILKTNKPSLESVLYSLSGLTKRYKGIRDTVFPIAVDLYKQILYVVNKFVDIKIIYFHKSFNIMIGNILTLISSLFATLFENM